MCSSEQWGFKDLPYEIMLEIFSYMSVEDMVLSMQDVCRHWRDVCREPRVWHRKTYCPPVEENEDVILNLLQKMTLLQELVLKFVVKERILYTVTETCPLLRKLALCRDQPLTCDFLQALTVQCPNIEELCIPLDKHCYRYGPTIIAQLAHLKHLVIASDCERRPLNLKPIGDGCPSLKGIELKVVNLSPEEFSYFLEKKADQLERISMKCWFLGECSLPFIVVCRKLKELYLECDCIGRPDATGGLLLLRDMPTIQSLTLDFLNDGAFECDEVLERRMVMNLFGKQGMSQLTELVLVNKVHYKTELADTIAKNCPRLRTLRFDEVPELTDESVAIVSKHLPRLECLSLKGSAITDVAVFHLANFTNLWHLDLAQCYGIKESGMKKLVDLKSLRVLVLDYCNIKGFPFSEVENKLRGLKHLNINNCMNVDWESVAKFCASCNQVIVSYSPPHAWKTFSFQYRDY